MTSQGYTCMKVKATKRRGNAIIAMIQPIIFLILPIFGDNVNG